MATLYADASGQLVFSTGLSFSIGHTPPPDATQSLTFDSETNPQLVKRLGIDWPGFRLVAGVLTFDGVTVPITADGPGETDRKRLQEIWTALKPTSPNLSQDQMKAMLRHLIREAHPEFRNQ